MKLSDETKQKIIDENSKWLENYGTLTKEERKKLGAFYTPASLIIDMIEKSGDFDPDDDYLDPTAGNAGILAALLIAGVNPEHIYCNELCEETLEIAKSRLQNLAVELYGRNIPDNHFRHENALTEAAYFTDIRDVK